MKPDRHLNLVQYVKSVISKYKRQGGKRNRKQQANRMIAFARFAYSIGVKRIDELGNRQVILYWQEHSKLADKTLTDHWYALKILWDLAEKPGLPPKPWLKAHGGMGANGHHGDLTAQAKHDAGREAEHS